MKTFILYGILALSFLITQNAFSQKGITYYSSNAIGADLVIFNMTDSQIAGEFRILANNQDFETLSTELDLFYRFKQNEYHRFSIGIGLSFEPFTEGDIGRPLFLIPANIEFFPFPNFKKASVLFELAPIFLIGDGTLESRSLIGLRYTFGK